MNHQRRLANLARQALKKHLVNADSLFGKPQKADYFSHWKDVPYLPVPGPEFAADEAWWMAELCRLAYTPGSEEATSLWQLGKPDRLDILEQRTPFSELLDIYEVGNHASIYTTESDGTILCFRGTSHWIQWVSNLLFEPEAWVPFSQETDCPEAFVHAGFQKIFNEIWPSLWPTLRLAPRPWIFTGHSLGGSLALLAHAAARADKVYTFGSPKLGNQAFVDTFLNNTIQIFNDDDIVPLLPMRDESLGDKAFRHGGKLIWLSENGEIQPATATYLERDPLERMEASRLDKINLLKEKPQWLRDHYSGSYCEKLGLHLG